MDLPVAVEVPGNTITVNTDKISEIVAKAQAELLSQKLDAEKKEMARLTNARIQFEQVEHDDRIEQLRMLKKKEAERQEMEWRLMHPEAAKERDRVERMAWERQQKTKDAETERANSKLKQEAENELLLAGKHREDKRFNMKMIGYMLIGVGASLVAFCSKL